MQGDELFAEWSYDGKNLLFQSVINDESRIYVYRLDDDNAVCLSKLKYNFRNPVWHPDGDKIVFDSDKDGIDYLYKLDLNTLEVRPLFHRNIKSRNASFSTSSRQVYFNGYDELTNRWEIYSYDFVYNNLNRLTEYRFGSCNPDIYNNGKQIVYCKINPADNKKNLEVINWYGEPKIEFDKFPAYHPSWGPSGFKIFFISTMDNEISELYSIWKDGSHLERHTHDSIWVANPVISPDGTKMAMSVLTDEDWDIFIFNFAEK
jgi:Tol biopolymer transport system component|tara:strand:- start:1201 stop:1983 length:783 start_codon:yes stop_codon:yes gene_type:complete